MNAESALLKKELDVTSVTSIETRLYALDEQLSAASKKKVPEKDWLNLFHEVCTAFRSASPEARVDIQIVFEDRHALLDLFTQYLTRMAQTAAQTAKQGSLDKTIKLLEEAALADAIIDGRGSMVDVQRAQKQLMSATNEVRFDMNRFLKKFETSADTYVLRSYQLQKANQQKQAIQVLGRAIQLNPALHKNEKIARFAAELTGESPRNALMTLEDSFLRNRFIEEWENPDLPKGARKLPPPKPQPKAITVGVIIQIIIGLISFGIASYLWYRQCRKIFIYAEPERNLFLLYMYLFVGGGIVLLGGSIIYRRLTIYRLLGRYFSDTRFDIRFNTASAIVASLTSILSGSIIIGGGVRGLHWINSFGSLNVLLTPRYGFSLGLGMSGFSLIISLVLTIVTHGK
ncbi:MAG: hypothetical protein ABI690_13340 [Chloroflexota bacterium]